MTAALEGMSGQQHTLTTFYLWEGGWVGPRASLDGWKISSSPGFDPGPFSP